MNIVVLDRLAMGEDLDFSILESLGTVTLYDSTEPSELEGRIAECDFLLTNKVRINGDTISRSNRLKLICVFATGYDNIDVACAKKHGIAVCNIPAYSTESVTLFTFATALSLITSLPSYQHYTKSGEYSNGTTPNRLSPTYHELAEKTWGIIGCGTIGTRVGEVAKSFGCRILTYQRHESKCFETVSLHTLLKNSDIISIHCPLTEETRHLISREELGLIKSTAILINEARGAVCDEQAVAEAIKQNAIGGFGCDVFSIEPFPTDHPFYEIKSYPNVCLTPHAAWAAYEARVRALNIVYENMSAFSCGEIKNRIV